MDETFNDRDFGEPPLVYGKNGEERLPADIWESACQMVDAYHKADDGDIPVDADDMLRTLIATNIWMERMRGDRRQ